MATDSHRVSPNLVVLFSDGEGSHLLCLFLYLIIEVLFIGPQLKVKTELLLFRADFVKGLAKTFESVVEELILCIFVSNLGHVLEMRVHFSFHSFYVGLCKGS